MDNRNDDYYDENIPEEQSLKSHLKNAAKEIAVSAVEEFVSEMQNEPDDIKDTVSKGIIGGIKNWLSTSATGRAVDRMINGKSSFEDCLNVTDTLNPLFAMAHQLLDSLRHGSCRQLCYSDMICGIMQNRPEAPDIAGCCVLLEDADPDFRITFIYIDSNDEPVFGDGPRPYGFYLLTKSLDDELVEAFGDSDMLVVR